MELINIYPEASLDDVSNDAQNAGYRSRAIPTLTTVVMKLAPIFTKGKNQSLSYIQRRMDDNCIAGRLAFYRNLPLLGSPPSPEAAFLIQDR